MLQPTSTAIIMIKLSPFFYIPFPPSQYADGNSWPILSFEFCYSEELSFLSLVIVPTVEFNELFIYELY